MASDRDPPPSDDMSPAESPRIVGRGTPARLFVIPLILVVLGVFSLLSIIWFTGAEEDPHDLVRAMRQLGKQSWKEAYAFSELLRNPAHDNLKDDTLLCRELASILSAQTKMGGADRKRVRFRVFLCRSLGEFRLEDGLPALLEAAGPVQNKIEIDVRYAALEAIAVRAGNLGADVVRRHPQAVEVLLAASRETDVQDLNHVPGELQSTAAFALGVVGGSDAVHRLIEMLDDPRPNVRYNAATGLARHGVEEAIPVLVEMLDEENQDAAKGETTPSARQLKRTTVLSNGIRAVVRLHTRNPTAARDSVVNALQKLSTSKRLSSRLRMDAETALLRLKKR